MDTYTIKMTRDESELTESALRHFLNADIVSATFEATQDLIVKISDHNYSVLFDETFDRPLIPMNVIPTN